MSNAIIQVKDLFKTYPGGTEAVRGVSFDVKEGEFYGFLGPNGAGKTTTMNMLVNLVKKTSGSILIDGIDLDKNPTEIYKRIGFAMQEIGLDETATAREMLQLHGRLYHMPKAIIYLTNHNQSLFALGVIAAERTLCPARLTCKVQI